MSLDCLLKTMKQKPKYTMIMTTMKCRSDLASFVARHMFVECVLLVFFMMVALVAVAVKINTVSFANQVSCIVSDRQITDPDPLITVLCIFTMVEKNNSLSGVTTSLIPVAENVTAAAIHSVNKTYALGSSHKCLYVESMATLDFLSHDSESSTKINPGYATLIGVLAMTGVFLFYWARRTNEKRKVLLNHDKLVGDDVWASHEIDDEKERNPDDDENEMLIIASPVSKSIKETAVDL